MLSTLSRSSTDRQAMLSDGVSRQNLGLHLSQPVYPFDNVALRTSPGKQFFYSGIQDGTGGTVVDWVTTISTTVGSVDELPQDTIYRLYAWTALSRLHGEQLVAAWRSIKDNYPWFLAAGSPVSIPHEAQRIKAKTGRMVERPSISIDED